MVAIPVSHSAHPAYALLYHGSDETILYTGGFRVDSFLTPDEFQKFKGGADVLTWLCENPNIRTDILIIEGTNIGLSRTLLSPQDALRTIRRILPSGNHA